MSGSKKQWMGWLIAIVLVLAVLEPAGRPGILPRPQRAPLRRLLDAVELWRLWRGSGEAVPPDVRSIPRQHLAANQPPVRPVGPEGQVILDHGSGW